MATDQFGFLAALPLHNLIFWGTLVFASIYGAILLYHWVRFAPRTLFFTVMSISYVAVLGASLLILYGAYIAIGTP